MSLTNLLLIFVTIQLLMISIQLYKISTQIGGKCGSDEN
jgi:hypothetical protein